MGRKGTYLAPPGSAEGDVEGREGRDLCADVLPKQRGSVGHRQQCWLAPLGPLRAAKEASSMPRRQLLPGSAALLLPPERRRSQLSARRDKSEIKAAWRRERQRRRE